MNSGNVNHNRLNIDHQKIKQIWLVSYINRSGSTFLLNELNKYNQIVSLPEGERVVKFLLQNPTKKIKDYKDLVIKINQMIERDQKLRLFGVSINESDIISCQNYIDVFFKFILKSANFLKPDAEVLVFKDTRLVKYFERLVQLETKYNLKFIFLTRDPRAIYCSQKKTIGSWGVPMSLNPLITAEEWNHFERLKLDVKSKSYNNLHEISYENLISDIELEMKKLFEATDISKESIVKTNQSNYVNLIPLHLRTIHQNINKQPIPEMVESWKFELSKNEIFAIQKVTKTFMNIENYKIIGVNVIWYNFIVVYLKWNLGYWIEQFKRLLFTNRDLSPMN